MAKTKSVKEPSKKLTASAMKQSTFQRRKEYASHLRKAATTIVTRKPARLWLRVDPNESSRLATHRTKRLSVDKTALPKFRPPLITKQEMEELGCMPVGILSNGPLSREQKNKLSFSPRTIDFEKTPLRGTPVRSKSLSESSEEERMEALTTSVENLRRSFETNQASAEDILIDLRALEFGRQPTVQSVSSFWKLKMDVQKSADDMREACIAGVHALFITKSRQEKLFLFDRIRKLLDDEVKQGVVVDVDENECNNSAQEVTPISQRTAKSPKFTIVPADTNASLKLYTPPEIETTPMVRTGSAAKTLRFTPLMASSQRRSTISSSSNKTERSSFKITPIRRSKRLAKASLSEQTIDEHFEKFDI